MRLLFPRCGRALACVLLLSFGFSTTSIQAQPAREPPAGVAWRVQGLWQVEGKGPPIVTGDAIEPGSLLRPSEEAAPHSITILLPDGQRILYECFTAKDCARGFRVPSLYRTPEPFAVHMLARIRTGLARSPRGRSGRFEPGDRETLPRDEILATLNPGNRVQVEGLAAKLPNGQYTYNLQPVDTAVPPQFQQFIMKNGPDLTMTLPSAGLYVATIVDDLNRPRIQLFIAAMEPARAAKFATPFHEAHRLLDEWNSDYQGWPVHAFQWAYLESLVRKSAGKDASLSREATRKAASKRVEPVQTAGGKTHSGNVTAEPTFSPKPGVFTGASAVALHCASPDATIHYTVDTSEPRDSSSVYRAPIMVKGTELTIKAFASVPGKKDSAVVTGIFRIQSQD